MSILFFVRNTIYVMGVLLAVRNNHLFTFGEHIYSIEADDYHKIGLDKAFVTKIDNNNNYIENDNHYDADKQSTIRKRDVIKGPSFIQNIDEKIADTDIENENKEVAGGMMRLATRESSNEKNFYSKHHLENPMKSKKSNTKAFPDISFITEFSHLINKEKTRGNSEKNHQVEEKAAKKDTFSSGKTESTDELPAKYIKALYEWNKNPKSTISLNKSSDSDRYRFDSISLPVHSIVKSGMEDPIVNPSENSDSSSSSVNRDTFANLKTYKPIVDSPAVNAEPVVPPHSSKMSAVSKMPPENKIHSLSKKSKQKINVLVNVNINEAPSIRSRVDDSDRNLHRGEMNPLRRTIVTQQAEKRHFPFFDPNVLSSHKKAMKSNFKSRQKSKKYLKESEIGSGEGSGSGGGETKQSLTFSKLNADSNDSSHVTIAGFTYPMEDHAVGAKNAYLEDENYEDEEYESSGSGQAILNLNASNYQTNAKIPSNKHARNKGRNHFNDKKIKSSSSKEIEDNIESSNSASNKDLKLSSDVESVKVTPTETFAPNKDFQVKMTHKDDSLEIEKPKSITKQVNGNQADQKEEILFSRKEKSEGMTTEAKDNLERKSAQEDKYETLEEVREKFKKWQSKITENFSTSLSNTNDDNKSGKAIDQGEEKAPEDITKQKDLYLKNVSTKIAKERIIEPEEKQVEDISSKAVDEIKQKAPLESDEKQTGFFKENQSENPKEKERGESRRKETMESKEKHADEFKEKQRESPKEDDSAEKSENTPDRAGSKDQRNEENHLRPKEVNEGKFAEIKESQTEDLRQDDKAEVKDRPSDEMKKGNSDESVESKFDDVKEQQSGSFRDKQQEKVFIEKQPDEFVKELMGVLPKESRSKKNQENIGKSYKEGNSIDEKKEEKAQDEKKYKDIKSSNQGEYNEADNSSNKEEKAPTKLKNPYLDESGNNNMEEASEGNKQFNEKVSEEMKMKENDEKDATVEDMNFGNVSNIPNGEKSSQPESGSVSQAKEANEFKIDQENSFAATLERIKAEEKKIEKEKEMSDENKYISSKLSSFKDTTKQLESETKKPSRKNLKQLRLYKEQILSEVQKIDDLMNEYHKDGHSTRELSEAKTVLENDLKLVKGLEKNMKKKTIKKEKGKHKKVAMPSSSYVTASHRNTDYSEDYSPKKDGEKSDDTKFSARNEQKLTKSNQGIPSAKFKESSSEKQSNKVKPSYENYFHSEPKLERKTEKKQSLDEVHKLLKAEIKRLKEKKNTRADTQLKNIRKLVQQHLKKLISGGDIDKAAFHSLAPDIKQLGELLKDRMKTLKGKKRRRKRKKKIWKDSTAMEKSASPKVKENNIHDPSLSSDYVDSMNNPFSAEKASNQLEPPLSQVKGSSSDQPKITQITSDQVQSNSSLMGPVNGVTENSLKTGNSEDIEIPNKEGMDLAQNINMKTLLKTLNEKLGAIYQKAKSVQESSFQTESSKSSLKQPARTLIHNAQVISVNPGSTQMYRSQKPASGTSVGSANVPSPEVQQQTNDPSAVVPAGEAQTMVENDDQDMTTIPLDTEVSSVQTTPVQSQNAQPAQPVQTTLSESQITQSEPATSEAIQSEAVPTEEVQSEETQAAASPSQDEKSVESSYTQPAAEGKDDLPQVPEEPEFDEDKAEPLAQLEPVNTLVETLERDITELWSYKDLYPNADSLGLDNEKVHNTYANLGSLSGLSLRRALNRALRGEDVGLGVVGGSISKGGPFSEKGLEYVLRSYFYAIEDYWNKVIRPVTGSSMIVRDISLGGISTDYYAYCLRNHLPDDRLTNIVLWELSANDMRRYDDSVKPKTQPLEQFTRNILSYRAKPALIFVNFFALFDWDPDLRANCRNFEDEGEDDVAKYYKITSLSWRNMVCPLLKEESQPLFNRNNLFSEDHFHPSILGHAQMSYIIIDYIRTEFLKNLVKMRPFFIGDAVDKLQIPKSVYMPRPMYKETVLWKPLCYTYMLVDSHLPNNSIPLHEENDSDFKYAIVRGFKIRSDKIAGMETKIKDQFIRYKLEIPRHENGGTEPFKQLGIMSFTDDRYAEIQFDSEHPTRLEAKKRFLEGTVIKTVAENIEPGEHTLTIRSGDNGFLICALILG